ncbi:hypothetical protein ElyMa_005849800 [Elysia marginata]|uniref:Uncharacterized protein n=1 Tax=Elysia marginata TaxID=1093978 RepID=A0AAV4G1C7_9GAST|nr:hypothetical protein ElyMa_005849800 [Elysia marginata]
MKQQSRIIPWRHDARRARRRSQSDRNYANLSAVRFSASNVQAEVKHGPDVHHIVSRLTISVSPLDLVTGRRSGAAAREMRHEQSSQRVLSTGQLATNWRRLVTSWPERRDQDCWTEMALQYDLEQVRRKSLS